MSAWANTYLCTATHYVKNVIDTCSSFEYDSRKLADWTCQALRAFVLATGIHIGYWLTQPKQKVGFHSYSTLC